LSIQPGADMAVNQSESELFEAAMKIQVEDEVLLEFLRKECTHYFSKIFNWPTVSQSIKPFKHSLKMEMLRRGEAQAQHADEWAGHKEHCEHGVRFENKCYKCP
jgi:hypothetical protein